MQVSGHPSEAKQAGAKQTTALDVITVGVVIARDTAKRIRWSERMNTILPRVTKPRSRHNYARTELVAKR